MKKKQIKDFDNSVASVVQSTTDKSHIHDGTINRVPVMDDDGKTFKDSTISSGTDNVSVGGEIVNDSAVFDVQSVNKGLLIPRMTTAQRTAISNPAEHLLLYDTDEQQFVQNKGTASVPEWVFFKRESGIVFDEITNRTQNKVGQMVSNIVSIVGNDTIFQSFDFDTANSFSFKNNNATADVGIGLSNAVAGTTYMIDFEQTTGSFNLVFPPSVKWSDGISPDFTTLDPGQKSLITLFFNGTNFVGSVVFNYQPLSLTKLSLTWAGQTSNVDVNGDLFKKNTGLTAYDGNLWSNETFSIDQSFVVFFHGNFNDLSNTFVGITDPALIVSDYGDIESSIYTRSATHSSFQLWSLTNSVSSVTKNGSAKYVLYYDGNAKKTIVMNYDFLNFAESLSAVPSVDYKVKMSIVDQSANADKIHFFTAPDGLDPQSLKRLLLKQNVGQPYFGDELVTNGDFSNGLTGWFSASATIINNAVNLNNVGLSGANTYISQGGVMTTNKKYVLKYDILSTNGGQLVLEDIILIPSDEVGSYELEFENGTKEVLAIRRSGSSTVNITIDNISVKEVIE